MEHRHKAIGDERRREANGRQPFICRFYGVALGQSLSQRGGFEVMTSYVDAPCDTRVFSRPGRFMMVAHTSLTITLGLGLEDV